MGVFAVRHLVLCALLMPLAYGALGASLVALLGLWGAFGDHSPAAAQLVQADARAAPGMGGAAAVALLALGGFVFVPSRFVRAVWQPTRAATYTNALCVGLLSVAVIAVLARWLLLLELTLAELAAMAVLNAAVSALTVFVMARRYRAR